MIRKAAVAGAFYPADPAILSRDVDRLLTEATTAERAADAVTAEHARGERLRAVIVPHAGYVYSGLTAATAYALIGSVARAGQRFDRVVVVGPTHRVAVHGCAYPTATAFATPLGNVPVWPGTAAALAGVPGVAAHDETHQDEHAIEVQLPFLQKVLPGVPFVPINAGQIRGEVLADVIEHLLDDSTLLVISSDLSHYLEYSQANEIDAFTLGQIMHLGGPLEHVQACGATPINGVLELARRHGWVPELLAACNSGDTAGDKDRVVGYCALAFWSNDDDANYDDDAAAIYGDDDAAIYDDDAAAIYDDDAAVYDDDDAANSRGRGGAVQFSNPSRRSGAAPSRHSGAWRLRHGPESQTNQQPAPALPDSAGATLIALARAAIEARLGLTSDPAPEWGDWASERAGTFVTLTKNGELRGCIGSLVDTRPLRESVPANALNAAFQDPRFPPVTAGEWPEIEVEVSVLTEPTELLVDGGAAGPRPPATEQEALDALELGVDGVIFKAGYRQATFLPQVWEQLPDKRVFLQHLRAKAGLPADYWGADVELLTYRVQAWEEHADA